jgi:hypothetical protein
MRFDTPFVEGLGASCDCSEACRGGARPWTAKKKKKTSAGDGTSQNMKNLDLTSMEHLRRPH